ncbi:uncharacterized protein LOC134203073 [Armigeres subalbatus]|uniref:uncharacterized protein LOC134203073 n=1 Tax=Armigeres subalbatus TaxID=124917 RepID=UPI002ED56FB9
MLLNQQTLEENYIPAEIYQEFYGIRGNTIRIQWVPSHNGINGNEIADAEAVAKSREPQTYFNGITMNDALIVSKDEVWEEWTRKYKTLSEEKGSWHYQLLEQPTKTIWNKNLALNPEQLKTLNRIRTGHCLTKDKRFKWGWEIDDQCEWCDTTEDLQHILYVCPKYNHSRVDYPALEYMKPSKIFYGKKNEEDLKQIVQFLNSNKIHI